MPTYTRAEMKETIDGYIEANRKARQDRDWGRHLGPFYAEDAVYTWNIGPNEEFRAHGRQQIVEWALGAQMEGFEDWSYPYDKVLIAGVPSYAIPLHSGDCKNTTLDESWVWDVLEQHERGRFSCKASELAGQSLKQSIAFLLGTERAG